MYGEVISRNLRRLRQEKGLTQEQLALIVGISAQSVSRWECGNTLPDVLLLPELARLYGVTVDDFYRESATAYPSYAQRMLAVYEASGRSEDFLTAEQEFQRMKELSADDLRAWGVLYHYMMNHCALLAQEKLEQAIAHPDKPDWVRASAAQQRIVLLCDLGKGREEAQRCDRLLAADDSDPQNWLLSAAAHYHSGNPRRAKEVAEKGIRRFPDHGPLYVYAGDICRALKEYGRAFWHWKRALELDPDMLDTRYSMASCQEEQGNFDQALMEWLSLQQELLHRGMTLESRYPQERADFCRKKLQ